jgi:hypothetical protein
MTPLDYGPRAMLYSLCIRFIQKLFPQSLETCDYISHLRLSSISSSVLKPSWFKELSEWETL